MNIYQVYLDPDFRRAPKSKIYCCRCQKSLKGKKQIKVSVDWENCSWMVWLDTEGKELIGGDCAKKIGLI